MKLADSFFNFFSLNLPNGLRFDNRDKDFDNRFVQSNTRKNQHVIFFENAWSVHAEMEAKVTAFASKEEALACAQERAQQMGTVAILHKKDGSIENSWVFARDAYPQRKVHPATDYPLQEHPGNHIL